MSNTNFKPGDRVVVVKEAVIESMYDDDSLIAAMPSFPFALPASIDELQPMPPFKRGDVVIYKPNPHAANTLTVLACFFDEHGNAMFAAKGQGMLFEAMRYELSTPQNDEQ